MRISDWSSDVCSSDLDDDQQCAFDQILLDRGDGRIDQLGAVIGLACNNVRRQRLVDFDQLVGDAIGNDAAVLASEQQEDRTSVVSGKSVSVRVDLGGGRISKPHKTNGENRTQL